MAVVAEVDVDGGDIGGAVVGVDVDGTAVGEGVIDVTIHRYRKLYEIQNFCLHFATSSIQFFLPLMSSMNIKESFPTFLLFH